MIAAELQAARLRREPQVVARGVAQLAFRKVPHRTVVTGKLGINRELSRRNRLSPFRQNSVIKKRETGSASFLSGEKDLTEV